MHLQLASKLFAVILFEERIIVWVWINSDGVERILLAGSVEHVLVNLAVVTTKRAVELPVWKVPRVDEPDRMRSDLLEELHDGVCPGKLNLSDSDCRRGVEFAGLALESVKSIQSEELLHEHQSLGVKVCSGAARVESLVEVLDHHILRMGTAQTVKVDQKVVPSLLLLITVLECLECEESRAPGKGGNNVLILSKDIECRANLGLLQEIGQNECGVV